MLRWQGRAECLPVLGYMDEVHRAVLSPSDQGEADDDDSQMVHARYEVDRDRDDTQDCNAH